MRRSILQIQTSELRSVQQHDLALAWAEEAENAPAVQIGKCARNRLKRQPKIIRDIATGQTAAAIRNKSRVTRNRTKLYVQAM